MHLRQVEVSRTVNLSKNLQRSVPTEHLNFRSIVFLSLVRLSSFVQISGQLNPSSFTLFVQIPHPWR
jgi:hypothetical protein